MMEKLQMEMEMEMEAGEDIGIGEDITLPLFPLSFSLHDSFLHSHCSACFSPLPNPHSSTSCPPFLYCSPICSSLHFSCAEFYLLQSLSSVSAPPSSTSDLRVALRLLHSLPSLSAKDGRISGLLTNREKLMTDNEIFTRIRDGAKAIAATRRLRDGKVAVTAANENDEVSLEESALCLVLTNAVEVQDNEGRTLGIAVYDHTFSWINHSCSPNACYRFLISPLSIAPFPSESRQAIVPAGSNGEKSAFSNIELTKGHGEYGPMIVVRSIKRIKKGEKVTVAYTDLLQPKAIRQSELWSKYRFSCCCTRCNASLPSYVDRMLQETTAANLASSSSSSYHSFHRDVANRNLIDYVDEVITEYLSSGDPESCCEKLESVLVLGLLDEPLETKEGKSQLTVKLHPLHHLALNAYMTLASAYRIRASEYLAVSSDTNGHQLEVFGMLRTGAAYSFLLAAASHHLFCFESSLIASVANFWTSAGESLLTLARSSLWDLFGKWELPESKHFSLAKYKCSNCSLLDRFEANFSHCHAVNNDFENISSKFLDCITSFSREVWSFLIQDCNYLKLLNDPFNLNSLGKLSNISDFVADSGYEAKKYANEERVTIFRLGFHCLLCGELLASICYGRNSHRTRYIQSLLCYDYQEK